MSLKKFRNIKLQESKLFIYTSTRCFFLVALDVHILLELIRVSGFSDLQRCQRRFSNMRI